jgi:hypothetical protein
MPADPDLSGVSAHVHRPMLSGRATGERRSQAMRTDPDLSGEPTPVQRPMLSRRSKAERRSQAMRTDPDLSGEPTPVHRRMLSRGSKAERRSQAMRAGTTTLSGEPTPVQRLLLPGGSKAERRSQAMRGGMSGKPTHFHRRMLPGGSTAKRGSQAMRADLSGEPTHLHRTMLPSGSKAERRSSAMRGDPHLSGEPAHLHRTMLPGVVDRRRSQQEHVHLSRRLDPEARRLRAGTMRAAPDLPARPASRRAQQQPVPLSEQPAAECRDRTMRDRPARVPSRHEAIHAKRSLSLSKSKAAGQRPVRGGRQNPRLPARIPESGRQLLSHQPNNQQRRLLPERAETAGRAMRIDDRTAEEAEGRDLHRRKGAGRPGQLHYADKALMEPGEVRMGRAEKSPGPRQRASGIAGMRSNTNCLNV